MDVRATIAAQLLAARGARPTGSEGQGERGSRWVNQQTGMHRDTLGRIERGVQPPTVAQARQLCALYGTQPSELPIMQHVPTRAEQLWADQMVTTITVEQLLALAWAQGDSMSDTVIGKSGRAGLDATPRMVTTKAGRKLIAEAAAKRAD